MGHRQGDSSVYVQYYMSTFNDVDCQSICFGSAPQYDLIHLAGRLLRHGDAPHALTDQQKFEVNQDPVLVSYREKRTSLLRQMKRQGYRTRAEAEGTQLAAQYDQYQKMANSLSRKMKAERLQRSIKEFHDRVHVEEIDRQLNGIMPPDVIVPPTLTYDLPERARVAYLFSLAADETGRQEIHALRLDLVRTLAQLCQRRESPCHRQMKRNKAQVYQEYQQPEVIPAAMQGKPPSKAASHFCPFCKWADDAVGECQRTKLWRIDSLARHLRTQHLQTMRMPICCPYDACSDILQHARHFASHVDLRHQLCLPQTVIPK